MAASSETLNKKRKREPSVDARITYHAPSKTFERLFQEHSLEDLKRVVRRKLDLPADLDVQLTQIRGNSFIVLEDEDDFEAFRVALEANSLAEMRVSVMPRDDISRPTSFAPKPSIAPILPEIPPPTKKRMTEDEPPQNLVSATDAKLSVTATIPTNKDSDLTHIRLNKASASAQPPVPLSASGQTLPEDQRPDAPKLKLKPKRKQQPISSPPSNEPIEPTSKDKVDSVPSPRPIAPATVEKKKRITRKKRQSYLEPGPQKEEGSAFVMQIINSVRTGHRTPQEILAAFNNKNSNQTACGSSWEPPLPVPNPSASFAAIEPPPPRKSRSPIKTLPTPMATPLGRNSALHVPEMAVQQPVKLSPLVCPICSKEAHLRNQCPELVQRVRKPHNKGETSPVRLIEDHQSNEPNPGSGSEKQEISNLSTSLEPQSSVLLSPPSIKALYRSGITIQSPGEGSSSPPSPAHEQSDDSHDEMDAAESLLELSAKNIAANLVSRSPTTVPAYASSEMDEMSNEGAKVESESSENDERRVALLASSHARRKPSESSRSKSSSDLPSNDTPSPASQQIALTAPPVVQCASLTRAWSKSTSPLSLTSAAVHPLPEVPELPVTRKFKSPIQRDTSVALGKEGQSQDEELEPTQGLHHAANTSAPRSHQPRSSQSLPRLSILPRTMTRLLLPKPTSRLVPTTPNPDRDEDEDIVSSDDSSDSDNQSSKHIPANQQAGSRPAFRRHHNVLASF